MITTPHHNPLTVFVDVALELELPSLLQLAELVMPAVSAVGSFDKVFSSKIPCSINQVIIHAYNIHINNVRRVCHLCFENNDLRDIITIYIFECD